MATSYRLSIPARNAAADAHCAALNGGTRELRTGPEPALLTDADSGTLIATFAFGSPAFGAAVNGIATANAVASVTAAASGTVAHFRDKASGGVVRAQGNVTNLGGDGSYKIDNPAIVAGQLCVFGVVTHEQKESP